MEERHGQSQTHGVPETNPAASLRISFVPRRTGGEDQNRLVSALDLQVRSERAYVDTPCMTTALQHALPPKGAQEVALKCLYRNCVRSNNVFLFRGFA